MTLGFSGPLYPHHVTRMRPAGRSATTGLLLGLIITLAAVVTYSWYITRQISGLRQLQSDLADRNRRDSLQLLRIQNDLNSLGLAMRDMLDGDQPYPLSAWSSQFRRIRRDLEDALQREEQVALANRTPEQRRYLGNAFAQFWDAADHIFAPAGAGQEEEARAQIRLSLQARQAALTTAVARLLVENNASEEQTAQRVAAIYGDVPRRPLWRPASPAVASGSPGSQGPSPETTPSPRNRRFPFQPSSWELSRQAALAPRDLLR